MPLLSSSSAGAIFYRLCPWTAADAALANAARAMTLDPVAAHCTCCCDRLCLKRVAPLRVV